MTLSEKIANIENTIKRHEYNFYVLGEKTISTPELEILKVELYNLKHSKNSLPSQESSAQSTAKIESDDDSFEFYDGI